MTTRFSKAISYQTEMGLHLFLQLLHVRVVLSEAAVVITILPAVRLALESYSIQAYTPGSDWSSRDAE